MLSRVRWKMAVVAVVAGVLSVGGLGFVRSQGTFPDGTFIRSQDGAHWIVSGGNKYAVIYADDESGALDGYVDAGNVRNIADVPPPVASPAPITPAADSRGLLGKSATRLCSILSRATFTATVESVEITKEKDGLVANGLWVIVVVSVANDGNVPDDAFKIAELIDGRGRRFEAVGTTDFTPYFALQRQLRVSSYIDTIQPGLSVRVLWVYEIPEDAQTLGLVSSRPMCRA